jgi:hypothetical protein
MLWPIRALRAYPVVEAIVASPGFVAGFNAGPV